MAICSPRLVVKSLKNQMAKGFKCPEFRTFQYIDFLSPGNQVWPCPEFWASRESVIDCITRWQLTNISSHTTGRYQLCQNETFAMDEKKVEIIRASVCYAEYLSGLTDNANQSVAAVSSNCNVNVNKKVGEQITCR